MRSMKIATVVNVLALAVAAVAMLPAPARAQADVPIAQRLVPVCNASSSTPYPVYDVTLGQWKCTTAVRLTKTISGMTDAAATNVLTVTVPAGVQPAAALLHLRIFGSLGAGGSKGKFECSAGLEGNVAITRVPSTVTVVNAATAAITANACVSGAATITLAYAASGVSGSTTAVNTFTITVTITKGSGTSANHQAVVIAELEPSANGITIK